MKTQLPSTAVFSSSEIQIQYKRPLFNSMKYISRVEHVVEVIREFSNEHQIDLKEFFWVLYLSNANRLIAINQVSVGNTKTTIVGIKEILQGALLTNASGVILVHNHPSGALKFSASDEELSSRIYHLAKYMEIDVLDHVIVTSEGYASLLETGFFFDLSF